MIVEPLAQPPDGTVRVPGSKSYTNRALVCAALAEGRSTLRGALVADDTVAMVEAVVALGATIERRDGGGLEGTTLSVEGLGGELRPGPVTLDARQSGTTARFLAPVLALGPGPYVLDGDEQLRSRPMGPSFDALRQLGVQVSEENRPGSLPATISGPVGGHDVELPGHISSQFLSGLLLAAAYLPRGLRIRLTSELVSRPYVEMTRETMRSFGGDVTTGELTFEVAPSRYHRADYTIEPDASAASYFFAAAAITAGRVRVEGLPAGSAQGDLRFVDLLERMGATVRREPGAVEVQGSEALDGIDCDMADLSDTVPTLAVVAPFATSTTTIRGVGFIRAKESDRIGGLVAELQRCGIDAEERPDGLVVRPSAPHGGRVRTYRDHRMAMAFAVLGLVTPGIDIDDPGCVAKTFPDFFSVVDGLRR